MFIIYNSISAGLLLQKVRKFRSGGILKDGVFYSEQAELSDSDDFRAGETLTPKEKYFFSEYAIPMIYKLLCLLRYLASLRKEVERDDHFFDKFWWLVLLSYDIPGRLIRVHISEGDRVENRL